MYAFMHTPRFTISLKYKHLLITHKTTRPCGQAKNRQAMRLETVKPRGVQKTLTSRGSQEKPSSYEARK